jgi:hypothetical protein
MRPGGKATGGSGGGQSGTGGTGAPSGDPKNPAPQAGAIDPGPLTLRRLSNLEYVNSVRDLLEPTAATLGRIALPSDFVPDHFDTNADVQSLNADHVRAFGDAARLVAAEIFASPERRTKVVGCDPAAAGCLKSFVTKQGRRVFRRPLEPAEVDAFVALAATETNANDGAALVLRTMLQTPSFLFRTEVGVAAPDRPGLRRLSGYEVATRLSFFLLGTTPSDALLDTAEQGGLDGADGVDKAARAMLADPRAKAPVRRFVRQWLALDRLEQVSRDKAKYPAFTATLPKDMIEETLRVAEDLAWTPGKHFLDFLDTRTSFVNAALAKLYGVSAPAQGWQKVEFPANAARAGVATHASILTLTAPDEATAPIFRGKYIRTQLLCEDLPVAPANIPAIDVIDPKLPSRQRLEKHRSDPSCAGCHQLLDPLGFGLDHYDAIGAYRTSDAAGRAIPNDGTLHGFADPAFRGGVELAAKLRASRAAAACVTNKLASFSIGRDVVGTDAALVGQLTDGFQKDGSLQGLMLALVKSDAFRYRRP